jgi:CheY-like chemotaxis protein
MEVVVCDDDPSVRQVVAEIATTLGFTLCGETDEPTAAVDLVERYEAGLLVLDLSLPHGDGMDALRVLRQRHSTCRVVVFSAYAFDPERISGAGADAVVDKLRFDELEEVLLQLGRVERRRDLGDRALPPPASLSSPRGLERRASFEQALAEARPADIAVVIALDDHDGLVEAWGELGTADLLVELAAHVRRASRADDRLAGAGARRLELALLGSRPGGARTVVERVRFAWETSDRRHHGEEGARPTFSAAFATVLHGELGREAMDRATAALARHQSAGGGRLWCADPT